MNHKKHHKRKNIMGNLPAGRFSRQSIARPHPAAVRSDTDGNTTAEQATDDQTNRAAGNTDDQCK